MNLWKKVSNAAQNRISSQSLIILNNALFNFNTIFSRKNDDTPTYILPLSYLRCVVRQKICIVFVRV